MVQRLLIALLAVIVVGVAVVLVGGWMLLSGYGQGYDADDIVDDTLDAIELRWSQHAGYVSPGEDLAAVAVGESYEGGRGDSPEDFVRVEALDWSGETASEDGATVVLRLVAHVGAYDDTAVFGHDNPEDDEIRCVTYTLGAGDRRAVDRDRHSCPDDAEAREPRFRDSAEFPDGIADQVRALLEDVTAETIGVEAQEQLRREEILVQTAVEDPAEGGRIVVTVSGSSVSDCVVGVKEPDGTVSIPGGFPREWLMPGEIGCTPALVLAPPT